MTTQVVYRCQRELIFQTVCELCMTLHQPLFLTSFVSTMKQDAILQGALGTLHHNKHLYGWAGVSVSAVGSSDIQAIRDADAATLIQLCQGMFGLAW